MKQQITGQLHKNPFIPDKIKAQFIKNTDNINKAIIDTIDQYFNIMIIPKIESNLNGSIKMTPEVSSSLILSKTQPDNEY